MTKEGLAGGATSLVGILRILFAFGSGNAEEKSQRLMSPAGLSGKCKFKIQDLTPNFPGDGWLFCLALVRMVRLFLDVLCTTKEGLAGGATYLVPNLRIAISRSEAGRLGAKVSASCRLPDSVEDDKFKIQDLTPSPFRRLKGRRVKLSAQANITPLPENI